MTKHFRFKKIVGNTCKVDSDKRTFCFLLMQQASRDFFTATCFALNENRACFAAKFRNAFTNLLRSGRRTHPTNGVAVCAWVDIAKTPKSFDFFNDQLHFFRSQRLCEESLCARLQAGFHQLTVQVT
ncbi:hypothetical protein D3C87_1824110 [compost metagenome]